MERAKRPWLSLIVLCLGTFAILLDSTAQELTRQRGGYRPRSASWIFNLRPSGSS
jgi:hypothetical protein